MGNEKDYIRFMANTQISSDLVKFFKQLEVFFKSKLSLSNVNFYYIPTNIKGFFPRKIITGPKTKISKMTLLKGDLKFFKKKNYFSRKNKIWFLLGRDQTGIYFVQSKITAKNKFDEKFFPIFSKYVQSSIKSIIIFKNELSLVDIDDVTGLYNQRRLYKDLDVQAKKNKETKAPFSVLFLDIDHFKSVNDGSGHLVGSQLLADLADRLKKVLRPSDTFYRYGGDEFVIILPGVSIYHGLKIGRRILKKIKEKPFKVADLGDSFNLSVSIGLATFPVHIKSVNGVLELADNMLYRAKDLGRGRVCSVADILGKGK